MDTHLSLSISIKRGESDFGLESRPPPKLTWPRLHSTDDERLTLSSPCRYHRTCCAVLEIIKSLSSKVVDEMGGYDTAETGVPSL